MFESITKKDNKISRSYNNDEVYSSIESVQVILGSGTDISTALDSVSNDISSKKLRIAFTAMSGDVKSGAKFWEVLDKYNLLGKRHIEIIKIGEESGLLVDNLELIITQREYEKDLSSKITSAMIYPFIVLVIGMIVAIGTAWFVLPKLTLVYSGMDVELPMITQVILRLGEIISEMNFLYFVLSLTLLTILFILSFRINKIKNLYESILLKTPGVKKIISEVEVSRMGMILGSLLSVGISIDDALEALRDATPFHAYKVTYSEMHTAILSGLSFKIFFENQQSNIINFPSTVKQMIEASEISGNLPKLFTYLGEKYRKKVTVTTQNLTVLLEPILLLLIWFFVAILALAIILPIYSLIGSF